MKELNNFEDYGNSPCVQQLTSIMNVVKSVLEYNLSGNVESSLIGDSVYATLFFAEDLSEIVEIEGFEDWGKDAKEALFRRETLDIKPVDEYGDFDFGNALPNTYSIIIVDRNWNPIGMVEEAEVVDEDLEVTAIEMT